MLNTPFVEYRAFLNIILHACMHIFNPPRMRREGYSSRLVCMYVCHAHTILAVYLGIIESVQSSAKSFIIS